MTRREAGGDVGSRGEDNCGGYYIWVYHSAINQLGTESSVPVASVWGLEH